MKISQFLLAGLLGAAVVYGVLFWMSRDRAARLNGTLINVRTLGMDEKSSVAILDFETHNPSDVLMIVAGREISLVDERGIERKASTISASDLKSLFDYFPALGAAENEPLVDRVRVGPGETLRGMVGARFDLPKHEIDKRVRIILTIRDADGGISQLSQDATP